MLSASAAGFSITDAATIQAYSAAIDAGNLPAEDPVYAFDADPANYPVPAPITEVVTSTICPSPATTAPTVTMGSTVLMEDCIPCVHATAHGACGLLPHIRSTAPGRRHQDASLGPGARPTPALNPAPSSQLASPHGRSPVDVCATRFRTVPPRR